MPFKSLAQQRYFMANREKLEAEGVDVNEWMTATKAAGAQLPNKVKAPKKTKLIAQALIGRK